jgi:6-phosphogluconolactonase
MVDVLRFDGAADLAAGAASRLMERVRAVSLRAPPFTIALSGGRVAPVFFDAIVAADRVGGGHPVPRLAFRPVHFFFADERCVPPGDPESNFSTARARLFEPLRVPSARVHRLRGEEVPAIAAHAAGAALRALLRTPPGDMPVLDLVCLGMGEDGHVASLFPGAPPEVTESPAVYVPAVGPKPPPQRLTLTFAALAAAREVWVLASGRGKEAALATSLAGGPTPLGRVLRENPRVTLFTELTAA